MKAMFLKELRENLKWGLLILGFFCLSVAGWIHEAGPNLLFDMVRPETTGVPLAVVGLALGLLQTWFETRPDNFAFVVHRPATRWEIFVSKSAAGLLLMYVGLAIPAAFVVWWASVPGHLATPFQWRSALPLVVDIVNAGSFYFTGMVLSMRKARWFGSRILPLALAVGCTIALREVPEFWQAMVFAVAGIVVCALAAWNVFASGGAAEGGGVPSVALGTMIYAGVLTIGIVVVSTQSMFQNTTVWRQLMVDRDGNVLQVTWRIADKLRTSVVGDADGHPLPEYEGIDPDEKTDDAPDRFVRFSAGLFDQDHADAGWLPLAGIFGYRHPTSGMVGLRTVAKYGTRLRRNCLFNVQNHVIEMYDPVTQSQVDTVGPSGFAPGDALPQDRFPTRPLGAMSQGPTHTLSFPNAVYWMELDKRRVRKIFDATADDPVVTATELPPQHDPPVVVVTEHHLHLLHPSGEKVFSAPHDLDLVHYWFALAVLPTNNHLMLRAGPVMAAAEPRPEIFLEFDRDGKLVRRTEPAAFPDDRPSTVGRRTTLAGLFYPLAGLPILAPWLMDEMFDTDLTHRWWMFHGVLFGAAILSGIVAVFLARRCGFSGRKTIAWSLGNVLLGPAGVIVMLSLNDWPARETCSACGGKRLVDRQECSRCGKPLPPPVVDGREIFEPEEVFAAA